YDARREEPCDDQQRLQPNGRQFRESGADPGQALRDPGRGQREDPRHAANGRNRAASADQGGHRLERGGAAADRRGITVLLAKQDFGCSALLRLFEGRVLGALAKVTSVAMVVKGTSAEF